MIEPTRRLTTEEYGVCPVHSGHYEDIARLAGQLGHESTVDQIRLRIEEMRDVQQYAVYVVEGPRGNVVGWIGICMFRAVETDAYASISGLVVDQKFRSRGIGKVLFDAAEEWAGSLGCDVITVKSNVKREQAHCFYRKNGYVQVKTQHTFCKSLKRATTFAC